MTDQEKYLLSDEEIEKAFIYTPDIEDLRIVSRMAVAKVLRIQAEERAAQTPAYDGNYHCCNCGKVFRIDEQAEFLKHQRDCTAQTPEQVMGRLISLLEHYFSEELGEGAATDIADEIVTIIHPLIEGDRKNPAKVVCLCGSTRFKDEFIKANFEQTMKGNIILTVGWFSHSDSEVYYPSPDEKDALDELHKRKIDLCDEVLVLNVGGYIGESTRSEIAYAESIGKSIRYLEGELPNNGKG